MLMALRVTVVGTWHLPRSVFPPHVLDRRCASPRSPGLCSETNAYVLHGKIAHNCLAFSVFYLLQRLKGCLGYELRPQAQAVVLDVRLRFFGVWG